MVPDDWTRNWIDAHCHLADPRLKLDPVLERSRTAGVTGWIQGGVGPKDWETQLELQKKLGPTFLTSFGLHPWWVIGATDADVDEALNILSQKLPQAQALGELGLDFA